jgi:hypothetical protein
MTTMEIIITLCRLFTSQNKNQQKPDPTGLAKNGPMIYDLGMIRDQGRPTNKRFQNEMIILTYRYQESIQPAGSMKME